MRSRETGPPIMSNQTQHIEALKKERNAVILAHTYQPGEVQDIADFVGDSYGLSVEATRVNAEVIVFCGVMFMAETAAILNPQKKVIIPEPTAGCPMADMITGEDLRELKKEHPDHLVMCYVNSTAEVKALSDICCTSSNAVTIARQIPAERKIVFVPDKYLGSYVQEQTGLDMVLWNGFCPTHARITADMITEARKQHPDAPVMIHPEATPECRGLSDQVLSTGGMCRFVAEDHHEEYIVATEIGIVHTLKQRNPGKRFYPVNKAVTCPNMRKGSVDTVVKALEGNAGEHVVVPEEIARRAKSSLTKMLEMSG